MDSTEADQPFLSRAVRIVRWTLALPLAALGYCLVMGVGAGALMVAGIAKFEAVNIYWVGCGLLWLWLNLASFVFVLVGSSIAPSRKLLVACVLAAGIMACYGLPLLGQLIECYKFSGYWTSNTLDWYEQRMLLSLPFTLTAGIGSGIVIERLYRKSTALAQCTFREVVKKMVNSKTLWTIAAAIFIVSAVCFFAVFNHNTIEAVVRRTQQSSLANQLTAQDLGASVQAVRMAGLMETPLPDYSYENTSGLTKPMPSFRINSERNNQKLLFLVFDDMTPTEDMRDVVSLPPFTDVVRASSLRDIRVDEGHVLLGSGYLHWFVGRYAKQNDAHGIDPTETILVAAYPAAEKGKSIVMIGRGLDSSKPYDWQSSLRLCDVMARDFTVRNWH